MSNNSSVLDLPFIMPSQAQKHVTHNEALQRLDVIVQLSVETFDSIVPPALPEDGAVYALGATPTGDWAGLDTGTIAAWTNGAWLTITPRTGWRAWGRQDQALRIWNGTAWTAQSAEADLENAPGVGVNTTSDSINRLAVAADATLLSHEGAGHQLKVNKAQAADTASLLFQSNWSGRAEMGLAGSDDFSVKVSADGTLWHTALQIDGQTGAVGIGEGTPQTTFHVQDTAAFGPVSGGQINGNLRLFPADRYPRIQAFAGNGATDVQITFDADRSAVFNDIGAVDGFVQWRSKNDGSLSNLMRLTADGDLGIGLTSPKRPLHINDIMRLEPSSAPANPDAGDIYFDAATAKLRCHDGTGWNDLF